MMVIITVLKGAKIACSASIEFSVSFRQVAKQSGYNRCPDKNVLYENQEKYDEQFKKPLTCTMVQGLFSESR